MSQEEDIALSWVHEALTGPLDAVSSDLWIRAGVLVAAATVAALLVNWVLTLLLHWAGRKTETDFDDRLLKIVRRPIFYSLLLAGLWLAAIELGGDTLSGRVVPSLLQTIVILLWLVASLKIASLVLGALSHLEDRFPLVTDRTLPLFDNLAKGLLVGGGLYVLCLSWNIDLAGWMVSAGVVGLAVGFAAKDTLANLFSGIFILADAPYKTGDFVILDSGERGMVTQIGLRTTRMLTRDDIEITIPNAVIANAKIINESGGPWEKERVRVKVGVAYGSDVDRVREILMDIARNHDAISEHPEPRVRMRGLGASSLDFELLGWIDEPVLRGRVLDALYVQVYKAFVAEGIEIPFPQTDVWVRRMPAEESS